MGGSKGTRWVAVSSIGFIFTSVPIHRYDFSRGGGASFISDGAEDDDDEDDPSSSGGGNIYNDEQGEALGM